jgi:hypothetical protein
MIAQRGLGCWIVVFGDQDGIKSANLFTSHAFIDKILKIITHLLKALPKMVPLSILVEHFHH